MIPQKMYPFVLDRSGRERLYTNKAMSYIMNKNTPCNHCPFLTYGQAKRRYNMANFCTKCGAPLRPGAKFCLKCGNQIKSAGTASAAPQNSGNTAPYTFPEPGNDRGKQWPRPPGEEAPTSGNRPCSSSLRC